jgi:hypothetical protein
MRLLPYARGRGVWGDGMAEQAGVERGGGLGFLGWLLGLVISTFSIATLIHYGIVTGDLTAPVQALLDAYHDAIGIVFNPIEPHVRGALHWLGGLIGWDIHLYPHWRHLFVLSLVFWTAEARAWWGIHNEVSNWKTISNAVVGLFVSFAGALAAGLVQLNTGNPAVEGLIAGLPIAAQSFARHAVAQDAIPGEYPWIEAIVDGISRALGIGFAAFVFAAVISSLSFTENLQSPGLFTLVVIVIGSGLLDLVRGIFFRGVHLVGNWFYGILEEFTTRRGLIMLGGFAGAALLFAADAALKLAAH